MTPATDASLLVWKDIPEKHLVARAQEGDEAAFAALFERHKRRVYSLCLRMTHVPADAEDLTQEAFLILFRKISSFRGDSSFSTWLYRLVANVALMHLRRRDPQPLSLDEDAKTGDESYRWEIGQADPHLIGCIDRISLNRALAKLSPGYRRVFELYEVQGYEHGQIAKIMHWSVGNSKSQLHKARRKLRGWLRLYRRGPVTAASRQQPAARTPKPSKRFPPAMSMPLAAAQG